MRRQEHVQDRKHNYIGSFQNGVRNTNACTRCGFPETAGIHKEVPPEPEWARPVTPTLFQFDMEHPTGRVLIDVHEERERQDQKFGSQRKNADLYWLGIEGEEFAEMSERFAQAARLVLHADEQGHASLTTAVAELRKELIQVAAVAVAWIEGIDQRSNPLSSQRR